MYCFGSTSVFSTLSQMEISAKFFSILACFYRILNYLSCFFFAVLPGKTDALMKPYKNNNKIYQQSKHLHQQWCHRYKIFTVAKHSAVIHKCNEKMYCSLLIDKRKLPKFHLRYLQYNIVLDFR